MNGSGASRDFRMDVPLPHLVLSLVLEFADAARSYEAERMTSGVQHHPEIGISVVLPLCQLGADAAHVMGCRVHVGDHPLEVDLLRRVRRRPRGSLIVKQRSKE